MQLPFALKKDFIVGLDVGDSSIKLVRLLRREKDLVFIGSDLREIAPSADSSIQEKEKAAQLRDLLRDVDIKRTKFIVSFNSTETGLRVLEEVRVNAQADSPFENFQDVPFADLERLLNGEHPQVQAAVLANIPPRVAAGVLACMDDERRTEMVHRIATMKPAPMRVLHDIAEMFREKTAQLPRYQAVAADGPDPAIKCAADILNASDSDGDSHVLDKISEDSPELVEAIRETMFTFDDLEKIDKITMQKILTDIDTKLLAIALKACSDPVKEAIFAAFSKRARDIILEERDLLGAVPLLEVQNSQKEIMVIIRGLIESGKITVNSGASSGQLVN